ncbi:SDR family NAD(P)-dependent oxidoreductase [Anaeromyxobacter diazotrophicus]|uniref:3-oxoacyl-ACP reductase n=1 Tax=Anaeromyxobacter diazotrophicus TaxID=2590199 RepID=A0A7I9VQ46_9BACT|nr:SDR family NAD(P)-dependent oxidoreductase [Anaeromyxobacter diazotrophicus]GEJ58481.1 3-oxoacyl-ACP reductase [Anaeromyxobacter diazotrophicus]
MELRDRVALVTGGDRGIGRAIALALADRGVHVALSFRSRASEAAAAVEELRARGRRAAAVRADLALEGEVERMVAAAVEAVGPIDLLVSNAGVGAAAGLDALDAALFDRTLAVNLRAAFLATRAVLPGMRSRRFGRLLYVSSTAAQVGGIIGPHYAASKAGLVGLAHAYASLLAPEGITANVLAPALVETEMIASNPLARPDHIPVQRFGRPEEVADLAVAVLANGYVTGQTFQVNGGVYFT